MKENEITTSASMRRRKFIYHEITEKGYVTLESIRKKGNEPAEQGGGFKAAPQSVNDDMKFIEEFLEITIYPSQIDEGHCYVNQSKPNATSMEARASVNRDGKIHIGQVAASLLLAAPEKNYLESDSRVSYINQPEEKKKKSADKKVNKIINPNPKNGNFENWKLFTPGSILRAIRSSSSPTASDVIERLNMFWSQHTRRAAIDTGSSINALVENFLCKVQIPSTNTTLHHYEIVTNSRRVFGVLGDPSVNIKTLIIGGSQHPKTEAVCGHLAEMFLENSGLKFGMAVIGATTVNIKEGYIGSDNINDSILKAKFLDRAVIRVVIADQSKFFYERFKGDNSVCVLDGSCVDIVIVDDFSSKNTYSSLADGDAYETIQANLARRGVVLLSAKEIGSYAK